MSVLARALLVLCYLLLSNGWAYYIVGIIFSLQKYTFVILGITLHLL